MLPAPCFTVGLVVLMIIVIPALTLDPQLPESSATYKYGRQDLSLHSSDPCTFLYLLFWVQLCLSVLCQDVRLCFVYLDFCLVCLAVACPWNYFLRLSTTWFTISICFLCFLNKAACTYVHLRLNNGMLCFTFTAYDPNPGRRNFRIKSQHVMCDPLLNAILHQETKRRWFLISPRLPRHLRWTWSSLSDARRSS